MLSNRANVENKLRAIDEAATKRERDGHKVIKFTLGDPLRYDFKPPELFAELYSQKVKEIAYYEESQGYLGLREVIAQNEGVDASDVVITNGASEGMQYIMGAIVNNNEIMVPNPTYPPYINYINYFGGKPIFYGTDERWQPDLDDINEKISNKTGGLVLINPNNPTGASYDKKILKGIAEIAEDKKIPIISDEIYIDLEFEKTWRFSEFEVDHIRVDGFSKRHLATGWRLGYLVFYGLEEIKKRVKNQCGFRLCMSSPLQHAAAEFLLRNDGKHTRELVKKLKERRDAAYKIIEESEYMSVVKPRGAFYMFVKVHGVQDTEKMVFDLINEGVAILPGDIFGYTKEPHFRMTILPTPDVLSEGLSIINDYLEKANK